MRHLIAVSIFALATSAAMAADAPLVVAEPAAGVDWSGFYAGVFGGANLQSSELPGYYSYYEGDYYGDYYRVNAQSFGGELGAAAGYNAQFGDFVLGAEGDLAWVSNSVESSQEYGYVKSQTNWLATARIKAGMLVGDSALVYGTAGVAAAGIDTLVCYDSSCDDGYEYGPDDIRYGLTVGVGAEAMIADNLSIDAKVLYTKFETVDATEAYYDYSSAHFDADIVSARVGLNWHLN